jgi:hypothetical protein
MVGGCEHVAAVVRATSVCPEGLQSKPTVQHVRHRFRGPVVGVHAVDGGEDKASAVTFNQAHAYRRPEGT